MSNGPMCRESQRRRGMLPASCQLWVVSEPTFVAMARIAELHPVLDRYVCYEALFQGLDKADRGCNA